MKELQKALETRGRGRDRIGVAGVQAGLDRLEVPVAEVVEGEVVELLHQVREVELVEVPLDRALGLREAGEDPALLQRRRPLLDLAYARLQDQSARVPELVGELPALEDRAF